MASTLLEQASRKAIDELSTNSQAFAEHFTEYPPEEQRALLREMGKRIAELKELEEWKRKWEALATTMPTTDLRIHVEKAEIPVEDHERAALERAEVQSKWHWLDAEPRMTHSIGWTEEALLAKDSHDPLKLCSKHEPELGVCDCSDYYEHGRTMGTRISSPLMLYRLCTLFGMPPQSIIGPSHDPGSWIAAMGYYRGAEPSYIEFSEHEGGAKCFFVGNSVEACDAAIELVNLLVRWDLANPNVDEDDVRIVAGRRSF
ncbi:hypothetical protein BLS_009263 [Venturia inaequalis]|uniref:Uncharacterized protein n=1 Tax=Venturia inaequalis TaxID=5025 RepID=A0A8H3U469_VENIN|nr:hypothetical protein EG327_001857 [Venturia inaequalis]KAE9963460.1 hypothetical protein BLS_009263 [Venturia inaequalis]